MTNERNDPGAATPGQDAPDANDQPEVSIIIVSYNTRDMTLACLASVFAETTVSSEVILIDNASSDGSAAAVAKDYPEVLLLEEADNHGFAMANNIAIRRARGRLVLLLNPDTIVLDSAIDRIVAFAHRRSDARIWGGRTLFADRTLNLSNCWRRMTIWNLACRTLGLDTRFSHSGVFNREAYGGWDRDTEEEVDIVSGCFLLIERSFWNELVGFDPTFVMYGEEVDLCLRARSRGARPRVTPEATIVHHGGASERVQSDKFVRLLAAKAALLHRHMTGPRRHAGLALLRAWPLTRCAAARLAATRLAAKVRRRRPATSGAEAGWCEVWARRSEWWDGYPTQPVVAAG